MNSIPKIIHYCWFGPNNVPDKIQENIKTWKIECPDYEVKEWNEKTFDVHLNKYTENAYNNKEWAFLSDYVRLWVINKYGGIYLDTDVQIIKNLDFFLKHDMFTGLESSDSIATGLILGAKKNNSNIRNLLSIYENIGMKNDGSPFKRITNVKITTDYFKKMGFKYSNKLQIISNCYIYPTTYFCPQLPGTKKVKLTSNTYTIHYYSGSWLKYEGIVGQIKYRGIHYKMLIRKFLRVFLGDDKIEELREYYRKRIKKN